MHAILEILSWVADILLGLFNRQDPRARRRQQMDDLDRREPKEWERLVGSSRDTA